MILRILLLPLSIALCTIAFLGELADSAYWWLWHKLDRGGWFL